MTKDEALKMAIEALAECLPQIDSGYRIVDEALETCKEALEQPAQQPAAWEYFEDKAYYEMYAVKQINNRNFDETIHVVREKEAKALCDWLNSLNTHPAPSWQGLSDDEIEALVKAYWKRGTTVNLNDLLEAHEQALKEKNRG